MENLRSLFLEKIKNIPFVECVDENKFFEEFINSPKETINEELIIRELLHGYNVDQIEMIVEGYFSGKSFTDVVQGIIKSAEINSNFKSCILEIVKTKNQKYYIPNIQKTETYEKLTAINDSYIDFLYLISGKNKNYIRDNDFSIGKSLDGTSQEITDFVNKFLDPKIYAKKIIRLLEYFDRGVQNKIIQNIINDNSYSFYLITEKNNPNIQKTKTFLDIFRDYLCEPENNTPEAPQEQKKQKKYKHNISAYIITYYLDCKATGDNPKKSKDDLKSVGEMYCEEHAPSTFERHFNDIFLKINDTNLKQKILEYLGDDWKNIVLSLSKDQKLLENFLQTL